jgi:transposase
MEYKYDEATLDLLRLTIPTYGIIVPIIQRSGTNEIIDGRHRMKVRDELAKEGVEIVLPVRHIDTDNPAEIDAIVNSIRRPWQDTAQRRDLVRRLRDRGHSHQRIADAVGTAKATVQRDLESETPTGPNGPVVPEDPKPSKGKDGRVTKPPATQEEVGKAWEMKDAGMSTPAIANDLGRGAQTVRDWLKKPRPETSPPPDTKPDPAPPLVLEAPPTTPKPKRPQIPDALKPTHQKEQRWLNERWMPIAEHLKAAHDLIRAEKERLSKEYAGPQGSLIMQRRWQQLGEAWADVGLLARFPEVTGEPSAETLPGLLAELERASRMANGWVVAMAIYTGCKPDPNRYQPTPEPEGEP